ncbi:FAD-binding oxidoreductase [Reichenbachiella agarivorans]|uniref:FAD-binding oxidoreductase n=1 Tax=Reichenbachiella agarivorans TaxID=2979464 RepID=A0ABY6CV47_9BACT|nr:FAD-dependent oxidoreductase [Reichenbachiella agarivorans]UXP33253.1 FAD-binding oxidoreductase [Reichenbachiella agarivorans]
MVNHKISEYLKDYLIIGHGLAGAVLSQQLLEKQQQITVLDLPTSNHSSSVAAGLYNPVTGRKMVKTWMADELFPVIEPFYRQLEQHLNSSFLLDIGIYRPFVSFEEQNDWDAKQSDDKYTPFIKSIRKKNLDSVSLHDPFGGIHLNHAGFVKIPQLLRASRAALIQAHVCEEKYFDQSQLKIKSDHITYENIAYRRLIFCNGIEALQTELFGWLPMHPVKGEILKAKMGKKITTILNRGVFILPLDHEHVRIGSNYQNHFDNILPTEKGKEEILQRLNGVLNEPVTIVDSTAGVRPATKDRRPIIGKHPEYEHIYIFNGFGSKGVSLIPYFSKQFMTYLETENGLIHDVNVSRYYKAYNSR